MVNVSILTIQHCTYMYCIELFGSIQVHLISVRSSASFFARVGADIRQLNDQDVTVPNVARVVGSD
jgi:hypothetical protein